MYDGATAAAEAMLMAVSASRKRDRVLIGATVNPPCAVMATYARYHGISTRRNSRRLTVVSPVATMWRRSWPMAMWQ